MGIINTILVNSLKRIPLLGLNAHTIIIQIVVTDNRPAIILYAKYSPKTDYITIMY